jgi:hypothetical protein
MPVTLVLGSAAEVASTYPAQVAWTHCAAEMTCAHHPKMTPAHPAAEVATATTTRKSGGRNASASHRYGGNHDRDSVQHKHTFPAARVAKRVAECCPRRWSTAALFYLWYLIIQQGERLLDLVGS